MMSRFTTIALISVGMLAGSTVATAQTPAYGRNQAPICNSAAQAEATNAGANDPGSAYPDSAYPGTVNYVEGSVLLDGNPLARRDVGRATMQPGEVLSTEAGKAEVLLTPGVFLRLDDNTAVKMVAPDLTHTQVELDKGHAALEVDQIFSQNDLEVTDGGVSVRALKPGFYEFNANQPTAMVFKGEAEVRADNGRVREIKEHHQMQLIAGADVKPAGFNTDDARDGLYNWSSLRSQYLAEANNQVASEYAGVSGFAPGWYWDPYMWDYTFIGLGPYWSPFGFGFYPPWGWYGGYWGRGYYGRGFYGGGYYGSRGFGGAGGGLGGFHGGGGGRR